MTEKVRCLVVDDEPLARELVETHIAQMPMLQHVASCDNAMNAFELLKSQPIDLMFLDIQMPLINGLDFLRSLRIPPKVIITTAFRNYALDGFELDVVDYLLKPITFQRFFKAIEKYRHLTATIRHNVPQDQENDFILLRSNKKNYKVQIGDILYVESLKDYSCVHTQSGELIIKQSISDIEQLLAAKAFLRIHRSYLVNFQKVSAFTASDVEINSKVLPIGSSYREKVSAAFSSGEPLK